MIDYRTDESQNLVAVCPVTVGLDTLTFEVPVGRWPGEAPDPGGLRMAPVVLLGDDDLLEVARAGALKAGGQPPVLILPADAPALGGQLLLAIAERVEVVFVTGADGRTANTVRALNGRPVPALPLPDLAACLSLLRGCEVDMNVPVPSLEGDERELLKEALVPLDLEAAHHIVEVDARPGLPAGQDVMEAGLATATASAAGVLAGRLVASNRRWRAQPD